MFLLCNMQVTFVASLFIICLNRWLLEHSTEPMQFFWIVRWGEAKCGLNSILKRETFYKHVTFLNMYFVLHVIISKTKKKKNIIFCAVNRAIFKISMSLTRYWTGIILKLQWNAQIFSSVLWSTSECKGLL